MSEQLPREELERQNFTLRVLCMYLLMERRQETQLSASYAILVQERHAQFHSLSGNRKDPEQTPFADCKNEICQAATAILKDSRSMATEVNDLSIQLVNEYLLRVVKTGNGCRAWLEEKKKVEGTPKGVIIPG